MQAGESSNGPRREVFDKARYITFDKSLVTISQCLGIRIFVHFHLNMT